MTAVPEGGRVHTVNEPSTEQSKDSIASSGASEVDGFGSQERILPSDVRSRILSAVSEGGSNSDFEKACQEHEFLRGCGLPLLAQPDPDRVKVKGKEHKIVFNGERVWKYQDGPALHPILKGKKLDVREATPSEYLARLTLQNELFGDDLRVEGILPNGKLVISQTTIRGGEPTEQEIEKTLIGLSWIRIPTRLHVLPNNLMATAWIHPAEKVVMVDARCPNFKKTVPGKVLAIDLMLTEATDEMLDIFSL